MNQEFPHAILHVDGDSFFASCETASRPWLRGKPVVTGLERGIASSMSYEAKAKGITRGMRIGEIRKRCPEVVIIGSDYDTYVLYAQRMYEIVRRYTPFVEEYSIDECFADVTGLDEVRGKSYLEIAGEVKSDLERSLGISFSIGVSVNKVTAKIASKWNKPSGLVVISSLDLPGYLEKLPIEKIWGIGWRTAAALRKRGILTAADFALLDRIMVNALAKPFREIYEELHGGFVYDVNVKRDAQSSISRTGTFRPPSSSKDFVFSELSKNAEEVARALRGRGMFARRIYFFIKTQEFRYLVDEVRLHAPISTPNEILSTIRPRFEALFHPGIEYRATGVTLSDLVIENHETLPLFDFTLGKNSETEVPFSKRMKGKSLRVVHETIDRLVHKYDRPIVFLGSSLKSFLKRGHGAPGPKLKSNVYRKRFSMPFLGVVR